MKTKNKCCFIPVPEFKIVPEKKYLTYILWKQHWTQSQFDNFENRNVWMIFVMRYFHTSNFLFSFDSFFATEESPSVQAGGGLWHLLYPVPAVHGGAPPPRRGLGGGWWTVGGGAGGPGRHFVVCQPAEGWREAARLRRPHRPEGSSLPTLLLRLRGAVARESWGAAELRPPRSAG